VELSTTRENSPPAPPVVWTLDSFPAGYGTRRFSTEFTRALHLTLSWARPIQSTSPHPTSTRSILTLSTHLRLGLPSGLFTSDFPWFSLYLTPWSWALLERSLVVWILDSSTEFYGTRRLNTEFTRALHLSLVWARPIQSRSPHPTSTRPILILSTHLRLGLSSGLFPSSFLWLSLYLTMWSWALLEKPPVVRPLDSFPAFYGIRSFNTEFTRALHLSLSWARPHHPIPCWTPYQYTDNRQPWAVLFTKIAILCGITPCSPLKSRDASTE
jgi:hypothetical protein